MGASSSAVRLIVSYSSWITFGIGTILNGILIQLIVRHTPKPMRIYSKILLQTSFTDFLLLVVTVLIEPISFTTSHGYNGRFVNGFIWISDPTNRIWAFLFYMLWIFLVYVSLFGYVSQFIFRYLALNRDTKISSKKYFCIFAGILLIPFVYCIGTGISYYPKEGHELLDDPDVAQLLAVNISDKILLAGFSTGGSLASFMFYYIIIFCTLAYVLIFCIGWLMWKFVRTNTMHGTSMNQHEKMVELNKQMTRNLIIQAMLPFTIYGPLVVCVPMFFPPALNPLVTILTIRQYRRAVARGLHQLWHALSCSTVPAQAMSTTVGVSGVVMPQQPSQNNWINRNNPIN